MLNEIGTVAAREEVAPGIFRLTIDSSAIAAETKPGQFVNIRVSENFQPLLRRPFSVSSRSGNEISIVFNIVGEGTRILASLPRGAKLDLLGPLGNSFMLDREFDAAILVGGGLGVAPLPLLTASLRGSKSIATFLGARTRSALVTAGLENVSVATDDGSSGFHGTVVELLRTRMDRSALFRPRIFACGPNAMLRALIALAGEFNISCEVSLESPMACGIGICQGCPVALKGEERTYALVCKDGTVFDGRRLAL